MQSLFYLLSLFFIVHCSATTCHYQQLYWLNLNESQWPVQEARLCDVPWYSILSIDTLRMTNRSNQLWVVGAHQYITARLNEAMSNDTDITTKESLLWLGDSLERACLNLSEWRVTSEAYTSIERLRLYNTLCDIIPPLATGTLSALYYIQTTDLLVIPVNMSLRYNKTLSYSLLSDEYRFRQFTMSGAVVGCLVGIPVLTIIIVILLERRRKYHLSKKKIKSPVTIGSSRGGGKASSSTLYV